MEIKNFILLGIGLITAGFPCVVDALETPAQVQTAFRHDCETLLIDSIKAAKKEIVIAIYSMTRDEIVDPLITKHKQGVAVKIKMDEEQGNSEWCKPLIKKLRRAGIIVDLIRMPNDRHMHHKFVVIDRTQVLTGSFNYTNAASTANWENLVKITNSEIAKTFLGEWQAIRDYVIKK